MSKILVVDDDKWICLMVSDALSPEHEIRTVQDGPSALSLAEQWKPNVVLLDIMMPEMSGLEVLQHLRQNEMTMNVPVVMLTARSDMESKSNGFNMGADDYIVKPFSLSELKLRIDAHLRRSQIASQEARYIPESTIRAPIVIHQHRSGLFKKSYQITKRLFDIVVVLLTLPIVLPVMVCIALLIWLTTRSSPFFNQDRTGMNGRRFKMYKFKTMVDNAEALKTKLLAQNELSWPDFKIKDDPRVTVIGKFLRRTSLDELPQVFNVLKGDMSLVGPRPTSFSADTYDLWHTERLEVRPGITGLWQVQGRSNIDFDQRVELDIDYIERQSWQLDLLILFHTVSAVLVGRGAS